jgi:hypothetical protein
VVGVGAVDYEDDLSRALAARCGMVDTENLDAMATGVVAQARYPDEFTVSGRPDDDQATAMLRCDQAGTPTKPFYERADRGFDRRIFADALGQADLLDPDDFAQYGVTGQALDDVRKRFAAWRRDLRDESSSG